MKLGPRDIEPFLRAPDKQAKAVLIYGVDEGLIRERAHKIVASVLGERFDPMNLIELTGEKIKTDPALLCDELSALSLMGGRRVIIVRDASDKIAPIITEAFAGLKTTTYLIVEANELSPSSALRGTFEREDGFAALACYHEEGAALEETIRNTLTAKGLRVSRDVVHYLAHHLGNDRAITTSELEKIALYMGNDKEVTAEIAAELINHNTSDTIEDICFAAALGKPAEVDALLHPLLGEGIQPVAIVRTLIKHLQRIELLQAQMAEGVSLTEVMSSIRPPLFFKSRPLVEKEITLWRHGVLALILDRLLQAEKDLKSSTLDPALTISHVLVGVAQQAGK